MNVISKKKLVEYGEQHAEAYQALLTWYGVVKKANWKDPNELRKDFPQADPVGDKRVVFNIKGNHFRLIARVSYEYKHVLIKWIGTHAEYNMINVLEV
ncbi:MAG: type II toxin-antitoxin system HigB family toxin [Bacteroidota bacterium]